MSSFDLLKWDKLLDKPCDVLVVADMLACLVSGRTVSRKK
jgi:hypothetical protein